MKKTFYCVPGTSSKLFVDLAAVTSMSWTDDGVDVTLSCGGRLNVSEDAALNIVETLFECLADEYATKGGLDSSRVVGVGDDLDGSHESDGTGLIEDH